jgi:beta-lactamase regulating signal transducer with metallopeptidase domain
MWVWLDHLGAVLFDAGLSTAIFLTLIVLAMLVCRQPSRRRLIARVALLASVAMIPLVALAPLPRLDLVDSIVRSNLLPPSFVFDFDQIDTQAPAATEYDGPSQSQTTNYLQDKIIRAGRWLPRGLVLADIACVAIGGAWLLLGFWGVRWLIRHSSEPSPTARALYERLVAQVRMGPARPALRVSSRVQHPVVFGVLKPTILIPPSYDESESQADTERLRLSLLHEIAHAEQFDPYFGTIASLAQTIWFFLPQIWWIRTQLLIDQEFLADRTAALRYGTTSDYATSLLELAEIRPDVRSDARSRGLEAGRLAGGTGTRSPLFQRMLMLLHCPFRVEARAPQSWSWGLRVIVLAASVLAACLCIRWPDPRALEDRFRVAPAPAAQPFRVADFVAEPLVFLPGGRALPYIMPLALPSRYELSVEVLASTSNLARIYIAGHALGQPRLSPDAADPYSSSADPAEKWHPVRLERRGREFSISVDGRPIPASLKPGTNNEWLSFEPGPDKPTHFRNLTVSW